MQSQGDILFLKKSPIKSKQLMGHLSWELTESDYFLIAFGLHKSSLPTATRPQASHTKLSFATFGLQTCLGLLAVSPQYSQV